jgi:hypothetical protein
VNWDIAEKIATAVLYEGYMLYPYRPSALKNQQRWNFGTLYPPQYENVRQGAERSQLHAECLLRVTQQTTLEIRVRFLQLAATESGSWAQAVEHNFQFSTGVKQLDCQRTFRFSVEQNKLAGFLQTGRLPIEDVPGVAGIHRLSIELANDSISDTLQSHENALSCAFVSAHIILAVNFGEFVSLLDPPENLQGTAGDCENVGCFPVLVGDSGQRNMLLCSPIILYDYPQIAPESAADFFDGTEMDEMLTLRVTTLTDEEKAQVRSSDLRASELLERTERAARDQLMKTHGTIRSMRPVSSHEQ